MANIAATISTILVVAMMLIIGAAVFSTFHADQRTDAAYELNIVKENIGIGAAGNVTLNNPVKYDSTYSLTCNGTAITRGTNYTVNFDTGKITYIGANNVTKGMCATSPAVLGVNATYTYYGGTAFNSVEKVGTQTFNAFQLGAMLPYVLAAVALIGILIAGFAVGRRED